jgi:hypothetical protein
MKLLENKVFYITILIYLYVIERSLGEHENIGDIISKWEQYTKMMAAKGLTSEFMFLFKKQLYFSSKLDTRDPVEFDLMFHQVYLVSFNSNPLQVDY